MSVNKNSSIWYTITICNFSVTFHNDIVVIKLCDIVLLTHVMLMLTSPHQC